MKIGEAVIQNNKDDDTSLNNWPNQKVLTRNSTPLKSLTACDWLIVGGDKKMWQAKISEWTAISQHANIAKICKIIILSNFL